MFDVEVKKVENGYVLLDRKTYKEHVFVCFADLVEFLFQFWDIEAGEKINWNKKV